MTRGHRTDMGRRGRRTGIVASGLALAPAAAIANRSPGSWQRRSSAATPASPPSHRRAAGGWRSRLPRWAGGHCQARCAGSSWWHAAGHQWEPACRNKQKVQPPHTHLHRCKEKEHGRGGGVGMGGVGVWRMWGASMASPGCAKWQRMRRGVCVWVWWGVVLDAWRA